MRTLVKILLTAAVVLLIGRLLPSVQIVSYTSAVWVAAVLALLNTFVKPILILFTLPVTILTMGLFILVINALIILMASNLVGGFYVPSFFSALLFSLLLSAFRTVLFTLIRDDEQTY